MIKLCAFPKCDRPRGIGRFCYAHVQQKYRHGSMSPLQPAGTKRTCKVKGCTKKHWAKNFCHSHYMALVRGLVVDPDEDRSCEFSGCSLKHYAKDYCYVHYMMNYWQAVSQVLQGIL